MDSVFSGKRPVWIVVKVESGVPVAVGIFNDVSTAKQQEQVIRLNMHAENDETGVFEAYAED